MKTPRELLLDRHRSANARLDAIRQRVVSGDIVRHESKAAFGSLIEMCREVFRMPRIAWAGLAAAWLIVIALNIASSDISAAPGAQAGNAPRRSPETLQALREQRRLFAELVGSGAANDAESPRFVPRPRSECVPQTAAV
jgi:hypothetical protein